MLRVPDDVTRWRCRSCASVVVWEPIDTGGLLADARAALAATPDRLPDEFQTELERLFTPEPEEDE